MDLMDVLPDEYKFKLMDARPELFNWRSISNEFKLSESFIEKHKDRVDWDMIFKYQELSDKFIEKYKYKVN